MGTVYQWIQNLSVWLVLSAVILHLVPGKDYGKYVRFFSGMVLLLLFLEPMLKLTGTDGMITKLYEGKLAKEEQAEKEVVKLPETIDGKKVREVDQLNFICYVKNFSNILCMIICQSYKIFQFYSPPLNPKLSLRHSKASHSFKLNCILQ